jgi:hypothetical protein
MMMPALDPCSLGKITSPSVARRTATELPTQLRLQLEASSGDHTSLVTTLITLT